MNDTESHATATCALARLPGFNVIGMASGNLGLGGAARQLISAMRARGFSVSVLDFDPGAGRKGYSNALKDLTVDQADSLPHQINLFILPATVMRKAVVWFYKLITRPNTTNVACVFWELPVLPRSWCDALEIFDVVVGMSAFVECTLSLHLSGTPVLLGLQPIALPTSVSPDRARFGLPTDSYIFLSSFDPVSDLARKNPLGALEAFRRAFGDDDKALLVFKVNAPMGSQAAGSTEVRLLQPLIERIGNDHRVKIISEVMSYEEVISLYASTDAFVSLHRAEGFGLGLLEMMGLGKPVIATDWSGNKTFMSHASACMVRHSLVPVVANISAYTTMIQGTHAFWADPDVDDAARWMRRLAFDRALSRAIGRRAYAAFDSYKSKADRLGFLDEVLALREHAASTLSVAQTSDERLDSIHRLLAGVRRDTMSFPAWLAWAGKQQFDRHLGWRFKGKVA